MRQRAEKLIGSASCSGRLCPAPTQNSADSSNTRRVTRQDRVTGPRTPWGQIHQITVFRRNQTHQFLTEASSVPHGGLCSSEAELCPGVMPLSPSLITAQVPSNGAGHQHTLLPSDISYDKFIPQFLFLRAKCYQQPLQHIPPTYSQVQPHLHSCKWRPRFSSTWV